MRRGDSAKRTKFLVVSAVLSALGVVFLGLGALLGDLDLTVAALTSILTVYAVIEIGGGYPWMIWLVTSFLSLLLLPLKTPAIFYFFLGYYPIVKEKAEKLAKLPCLLLKLLCCVGSVGLLLLTFRIFFPTLLEQMATWAWFALFPLSVVCFLLFDYVLSKLITFYFVRLRGRLKLK